MRKRVLAGLLAAALLLSLTGCGGTEEGALPVVSPAPSPTPEPVAMEFALPQTAGSLNPISGGDRVNLSFAGLLWEGLFVLDGTFTPQNVLCQSYVVSEDGLTWRFSLRPGIHFSDGSPLTAEDVAASLRLAKQPESRYAGRMWNLRSIRAENGEVAVTLNTPNGNLPALLDIPILKGALGTGPYVLTETEDGNALSRRTDWWQGKTLLPETIPLRPVPEADDLIAAFDSGDISLVTADLTGTNALGYAGNYEVWDYPTSTMLFVGFNAARGPCADPALRRALQRGFDRNTVAGALYARHARAAALPVSPASPLYDQTLADGLSYSPQDLAAGLAAAGYTPGSDGVLRQGRQQLTLKLIVNTDNSFRAKTAEYLADELGRAGLAVTLEKLTWNDYQKALTAGEFDLFLGQTLLTADFDPAALLLPGGALNFGRYAQAETTALLSAYQAAAGEARKVAASALYANLALNAPFAVLSFQNQSVLTRWGMVSGLTPTQGDVFFGMEGWKLRQ